MPPPRSILAVLDVDKVKSATAYVRDLSAEDKGVIQTWIVAEATLAIVYYLLLAGVVFFLGRRIIQAAIAAYREARAESV